MLTQTPVLAGTAPSFTAPVSSDTAEVGATLIVKNGSGASITVTFITPGTLPTGDPYPDKAYTIAAAGEAWLPVLTDYRSVDPRFASVTFSATASVTAAVVRLA